MCPAAALTLNALVAMQVAAGVAHLHERGIIHKDIAARNVLLSPGLRVRIGDFGQSEFEANLRRLSKADLNARANAIRKFVQDYKNDDPTAKYFELQGRVTTGIFCSLLAVSSLLLLLSARNTKMGNAAGRVSAKPEEKAAVVQLEGFPLKVCRRGTASLIAVRFALSGCRPKRCKTACTPRTRVSAPIACAHANRCAQMCTRSVACCMSWLWASHRTPGRRMSKSTTQSPRRRRHIRSCQNLKCRTASK